MVHGSKPVPQNCKSGRCRTSMPVRVEAVSIADAKSLMDEYVLEVLKFMKQNVWTINLGDDDTPEYVLDRFKRDNNDI